MAAFTINVDGLPIPQGSLISNGFGRGLRHSNQARLKPWRYQVAEMINRHRPADWDPSAPLSVIATFRFQRPAGHYGTGKNRGNLKASAPQYHLVKPDLDKLQRAIGDSITDSGLVRDDSRICRWNVDKRYVIGDEPPGVLLTLLSLPG